MSNVRVVGSLTFLGKVLSITADYNADQIDLIDELAIPDSTTNMELDFAPGLFAKMRLLAFLTDGEVTVKSNSTSAPDFTLTGLDGLALWPGAAVTGLGGTGITKLYLSNASGAARKFSAVCVRDITP